MVTIHPSVRLVCEPKKKKEGRKKDTRNNGKLAIRPDHPRRRIKITLCMVGGLRCVVICFKKPSKSANGLRRCGGRKWPFSITLASGLYNSLYWPYKPWSAVQMKPHSRCIRQILNLGPRSHMYLAYSEILFGNHIIIPTSNLSDARKILRRIPKIQGTFMGISPQASL